MLPVALQALCNALCMMYRKTVSTALTGFLCSALLCSSCWQYQALFSDDGMVGNGGASRSHPWHSPANTHWNTLHEKNWYKLAKLHSFNLSSACAQMLHEIAAGPTAHSATRLRICISPLFPFYIMTPKAARRGRTHSPSANTAFWATQMSASCDSQRRVSF